ncbi:2-keto-4-pentenoate hydratase [Kitasatospora sp. NPDC059146]|uniref:2-keto-4-pentenoate hydratase n=1 Tax=unclassified Kitasatospora TaxID=2633591 RepID=UPI0036A09F57
MPPDLPDLGAALTGQGPGGEVAPWIEQEALALWQAERAAVPVTSLTARRPDVDLVDAYRIQRAGAALRIVAGPRPIGHKVGLTSEAMRRQVGIAEPDSGVLLDYMAVPSGGTVDTAALVSPLIESEFAFRLGEDLAGEAVDVAAARAAVSEAMVALEIIDTRYRGRQLALADSVADNAACARIVTGPVVPFRPGLHLPERLLSLRSGGAPAASGTGPRSSATRSRPWRGWPGAWPRSAPDSRRATSCCSVPCTRPSRCAPACSSKPAAPSCPR